MRKRIRVFIGLLLWAGLFGAPLGWAQEHRVVMTDQLTFKPGTLQIQAGETVTWVNQSVIAHTATADPEKATMASSVSLPQGAERFDSGMLDQGESYSHTFTQPGRYHYFCIPHDGANMYGVIEVQE